MTKLSMKDTNRKALAISLCKILQRLIIARSDKHLTKSICLNFFSRDGALTLAH